MSKISRWELHHRLCVLYGVVADSLGVEDADCVCMGIDAKLEAHERSVMVEERPMKYIEMRAFHTPWVTFAVFALGMAAGAILVW